MPKAAPKEPAKPEKRRPMPDTDWFNSRMDALGLSNAQIAPEFGLAPNKLWQMKTGNRSIRCDELLIWARVLQTHPGELFRRLGLEWPAATVPVIGRVRPNGRVERIAVGTTAPAPAELSGALVAVTVARTLGAGMHAGATLYYEPHVSVHVSSFGRLSVLGFGDHAEPIVGVLESAALGQARAVVIGTGEVVYTDQAISAAPVLWIKAG